MRRVRVTGRRAMVAEPALHTVPQISPMTVRRALLVTAHTSPRCHAPTPRPGLFERGQLAVESFWIRWLSESAT